jgi:pilus assembly protein CpaE
MLAAKIDSRPPEPPAQTITRGALLASVADDVTRETVKAVLAQLGWQNAKCREGGAEAALDFIKADGVPALLLVDISGSADPLDAIEALIAVCGGDTKLVAIGLENDVGLYRRLVERGVSDYLVKPVQSQVLLDAVLSAMRAERSEPAQARAARVVAIIGARGGVGATTIATSAAWTMAKEKQQRVVLLDLDLHFGSLALSLDLEPGRGLREILTNPDRVDSLLIRSAMSKAGEGLRVLAAEEPLEDVLPGNQAGLDALLADLAGSTDCVVIDVPRVLTGLNRHALAIADMVAIVSEQSLPAMRDTQRLLALVKTLRADAHAVVVANRVGGVAGEIGRADFERGIGAKVDFSVPADTKAAIAAAERAKAFVEVARDAKCLAELRRLASALAGAGQVRKLSLFKRMLGK